MGIVLHRQVVDVAGVVVPWGLVAVLVTSGLVAWAVSRRDRLAGAWFGLGWAAAMLVENVAPTRSTLVASDGLGSSFLVLTLVVIAVAVLGASRPPR